MATPATPTTPTTAQGPVANLGAAVQADWENRQFTGTLSLNVRKLFEFLLQFESTIRGKLAALNDKLTVLERKVEFLEAQCGSTMPGGGGGAS